MEFHCLYAKTYTPDLFFNIDIYQGCYHLIFINLFEIKLRKTCSSGNLSNHKVLP